MIVYFHLYDFGGNLPCGKLSNFKFILPTVN